MRDPFTLLVAQHEQFCDRDSEKAELLDHIRNIHNVVLSAKRRMGKTSMVQQIFNKIQSEGILTVYVDIFKASNEKDFITIFAAGVVEGVGRGAIDERSYLERVTSFFTRIVPRLEITPEGFGVEIRFDKSIPAELLLEDVLDSLYKHAKSNQQRITVCLDEFQDITKFKDSRSIEGTLRSHIQFGGNINFLFAGSKRGMLKDMFVEKNRPLYKMTYPMTIQEIPRADFVSYIEERFQSTNKTCPTDVAGLIYDSVSGHTYYVQKLASLSWSRTDSLCTEAIVRDVYNTLLKSEVATELEGIWRGLSLGQKSVLKAIAKEPTRSPYSLEFSTTHDIATGSIRRALEYLLKEDYVEILADGTYTLTNPVFRTWLSE